MSFGGAREMGGKLKLGGYLEEFIAAVYVLITDETYLVLFIDVRLGRRVKISFYQKSGTKHVCANSNSSLANNQMS